MRVLTSVLISKSFAIQSRIRVQSQLTVPYSLDTAEVLSIPRTDDIVGRYCESDPSSTPRLSWMEFGGPTDDDTNMREHLLYGKCEEDSDCAGKGSTRPYCVDSICRECREGYEIEDCGTVGAFCSADTGYTCSSCSTDNDCPSLSYCRTVSNIKTLIGSNKMPRKSCVKCDSVPESGEVTNESSCAWRCPIEQYLLTGSGPGDQSTCMDCPSCSAGQFYAPRTNLKSQFVSVCTNATDIVCNECSNIGIDDTKEEMCVTLLSPSMRHLDDISVGDLGGHMPCRFFKCKEGWFLSGTRSKCKKCHLTMCPLGQFLKGCGPVNPGSCEICPGRLPKGAFFIDPTDPQYKIKNPEDVCQYKCGPNTYFDTDENACIRCDPSDSSDSCNGSRVYTLSTI